MCIDSCRIYCPTTKLLPGTSLSLSATWSTATVFHFNTVFVRFVPQDLQWQYFLSMAATLIVSFDVLILIDLFRATLQSTQTQSHSFDEYRHANTNILRC